MVAPLLLIISPKNGRVGEVPSSHKSKRLNPIRNPTLKNNYYC